MVNELFKTDELPHLYPLYPLGCKSSFGTFFLSTESYLTETQLKRFIV